MGIRLDGGVGACINKRLTKFKHYYQDTAIENLDKLDNIGIIASKAKAKSTSQLYY